MAKIIWITGGSSGLGSAFARHAAAQGTTVAVSARRPELLAELAAMGQGHIHAFPLDVTDEAATEAVVSEIEDRLGPIDIAVLNAGTHQETPVTGFKAADVERLTALNLIGTAKGVEALLPRMTARRSGRLALVASLAGYRGLPRAAGYSASKAAVIAMAESLKPELDAFGVTIQVINPGFVRTPLTDKNDFPMPYLMEPEEAAQRMWRGLQGNRFEISFPRRFVWQMKLLQRLPDPLYFWAVKQITGVGKTNG